MKKINFKKSDVVEYIHFTNKSINFELVFRFGEIEIETAPGLNNIKLDLIIRPDMFNKKFINTVVIDDECEQDDDNTLYFETIEQFVESLILRNLEDNYITFNTDRFNKKLYDYSSVVDGITESKDDNKSIFDAMISFLSGIANNPLLRKYFTFVHHYLQFYTQNTEKMSGQLLFKDPSNGEKLKLNDKLKLDWEDDKIVPILDSVLSNPIEDIDIYLSTVNNGVKLEILPLTENKVEELDVMKEILKIVLNKDAEYRTTFIPERHLNIRGYGFGLIHSFPIFYTLDSNLNKKVFCLEKEYSDRLFSISERTYGKEDNIEIGEVKHYGITDVELFDLLPDTVITDLLRFNDVLKYLYSEINGKSLIMRLKSKIFDLALNSKDTALTRDGSISFGISFDDGVLSITPTVDPLSVSPERFSTLLTDGFVLFKKEVDELITSGVTGNDTDNAFILNVMCKIYDIMEVM